MWSLLFIPILISSCSASRVPFVLRQRAPETTPRTPTREEIQQDLGTHLSNNSNIFFPNSTVYENATSRWSAYGIPDIAIVVEPATADDVATTIRYANMVQKPFLAVNRGHGSADTLSSVQNGIEIWMHRFRQFALASDGQSARLGGGLDVQDIIDGMAAVGKMAATGSCACVGVMGAGLGGGHGRLQGLLGIITDNILEANLVLWNGTQIVVSPTSHSELFWGLRGAGHNFGIVTDFLYRVHEPVAESFFHANLQFNGSMLERTFDLVQSQSDEGQPAELMQRHIQIRWAPEIDPLHPIVEVPFTYAGSAGDVAPYFEPFLALGPLVQTVNESVPYTQIPNVDGSGRDSPLCSHGRQNMQFATYLYELNSTAGREVYDIFEEATTALPAARLGSVALFERYSTQAMQSVPDDATAFPHRRYDYLFTHILGFEPGSVSNGDAIVYGERLRETLREGAPGVDLGVYVNYAFGNETLSAVYGEDWRLERLRALKHSYDPEDKFSAYMPFS